VGLTGATGDREHPARVGRRRRAEVRQRAVGREPQRVGTQLLRDLAGYWSARRGQYQVIYAIDEDEVVVTVVNVDHRRDV
jgi:mRNA-degrading endonuclease RelE of RelBE toxin-antitoxin system